MTRALCSVAITGLAAFGTACASSGAVPRPFPMAGVQTERPAPRAPSAALVPPGPATFFGSVVETALELRGAPYRNGGGDPNGFDCSGFTQYVFAKHGLPLPRDVHDQFRVGTPIDPTADLAPGDLLFFTTTAPGATHVAISLGGDTFVHAPSSKGVVRVESLTTGYWTERFLGARRLTQP